MERIDWAGVPQRLANLAVSPNASKVFGYLGHGFEVEPVLQPGELEELEEQLAIRLPDDYRSFLLNVGRGGAGPFYGIFPVRQIAGRWAWAGDGADLTDLGRLTEPFPVQGPDESVLEGLLAERPDEETFNDIEDFDAAYEAWDRRYVSMMWNQARTVGAICLCHEGCAARDWLVVSGPERGNIWMDHRVDDKDLFPGRLGNLDRITFADWYLDWLAAAEKEAGI